MAHIIKTRQINVRKVTSEDISNSRKTDYVILCPACAEIFTWEEYDKNPPMLYAPPACSICGR